MNYVGYERISKEYKEKRILRRKKRHHAEYLPEMEKGQLGFVKAPTNIGKDAIVDRKDEHPDSYCGHCRKQYYQA